MHDNRQLLTMKYAFNLEWNELPEELREAKIQEYILAGDKRDCEECDGVGEIPMAMERGDIKASKPCGNCSGTGRVNPDPDDLHQQEEAEEDIRIHFPIYF